MKKYSIYYGGGENPTGWNIQAQYPKPNNYIFLKIRKH